MNPSALSTGLKWGVIYGLVSTIFGLVLYVLNQSTNMTMGFVGILIFIVFVILAMRDHNKKSTSMTYGQGILIGLFVALIGGLFAAIYSYAIFALDPELVKLTQEKSIEVSEGMMQWMGMDSDQIDEAIDQAEEAGQFEVTPMKQSISTFFTTLFIGIFFSLVPAIFFRKKGSKY